MSILIGGNKAKKILWGSTEVKKIFWGSTKVYPSTVQRYLIGGSDSTKRKWSEDLTTWTDSNPDSTSSYYYVTYDGACGNNRFVVVGCRWNDGSNNLPHALISTDGKTWSTKWQFDGTNTLYKRIDFCKDRFIAFASDTYQAGVVISTDGSSWTYKNLGTESYWYCAAYGAGKYVILGRSSYGYYSSDGSTWTRMNVGYTVNDVAFGGDKFVAVRWENGKKPLISTNGTSWSEGSTALSWNIKYIAYGNGVWVAFPGSADDERVTRYYTSTDGSTWTSRSIPTSVTDPWHWRGITFLNGKFYALGSDYYSACSSDGVTWTRWNTSSVPTPYYLLGGEVEA